MSEVIEREEFVDAYMRCIGEAVTTIGENRLWCPTLLLDLGNEVVRTQLDSEPAVQFAHERLHLSGTLQAIRNTLPRSRPVETVMVLVVLMGPLGSTIRPSEDPRRRSALVIYKQVPSGAYMCVAGEFWVGDDGSVSWADEPMLEGNTDDLVRKVYDALADWMVAP
jgi:hypothetical protein